MLSRKWLNLCGLLCVCMLGLQAMAQADEDVVRKPIPSIAERKEALSILEDAYAKELKSRDKAILSSLADTFRQKAGENGIDDTSRYILLKQASVLAAQTADVPSVISDINDIGKVYDIDTDMVVLDGLKQASRATKKPEAFVAITESLMGIIQRSFEQDRFDLASKALSEAGSASRRSKDKSLKDELSALKKEYTEKSRRYKSYQAGLKVLKTTPDDSAANTKAAYYLCFVKQDWEGGLDYLAKGGDKILEPLALEELMGAETLETRLKLADGYYAAAEKKKINKVMAGVLLGKAKQFYDAVLPEMAGMQKLKVEKRLEELAEFELKLGGHTSKRIITKGLILHGNFDGTRAPLKGAGNKPFPFLADGVRFGRGVTNGAAEFTQDAYFVMSKPLASLGVQQSVTISLWFKPTGAGIIMNEMGKPDLANPRNVGGYHCSIFEVGADGRCVTRLWQLNAIELGKARMGQWNHVVLRYDATTHQFDGFLNKRHTLGMKRQRQGAGTTHYGFSLGDKTNILSDKGFTGSVDDLLVYNRALTNKEISQL